MVQKREKQETQEQNIYSPYYYPSFSRYNYPSKIGGDEEQYTEPKFSFPYWDDEVQPYTPTPHLRRRNSSPLFYSEDVEYFNNKSLSNNNPNMTPSDSEEDESETICDKIQSDIDLARKDQKTDYDQFRKTYATFHDDIRALQSEIEAIEAVCMKNGWDLKRGGGANLGGAMINDDGTEIYYEPTTACTITDSTEGSRLTSIPSATAAAAAARGMIAKKRSSPSILYRNKVNNQQQDQQQNISGGFNDNNNNNNNNNSNNRRCLGIEDAWQERVHQNEGIRC